MLVKIFHVKVKWGNHVKVTSAKYLKVKWGNHVKVKSGKHLKVISGKHLKVKLGKIYFKTKLKSIIHQLEILVEVLHVLSINIILIRSFQCHR